MEGGAGSLSGLSMAAVLGKEKDRQQSVNHRTLLDIIRQEEPNCRAYENLIDRQESKKGWSFFKDRRLRAKRIMDDDSRHVGVPAAASDVGFCRDLVSTCNGMVVGAGSENSQRPALAQLLRDSSVRVVEQVREDSESGEVPLEVTGQAQSQRINEQVLEDDDSGEVPWAVTGEGQSLSQYLSRVGTSRQSDVDHEDSLGIDHVTVSDVPVPALNSLSSMLTRNLLQIRSADQSDEPVRSVRLSEALAAEREHMHVAVSTTEADRSGQNEVAEINHSDGERAEAANEQQQVRISLMELLEETDSRQNGWSSYTADVEDCTGVSNENIEEEGSNFVNQNCCVCMVRHKGSAFIPCGHTFCRQCSRELWVKRGNCPICNGFILEILDIF